MPARTLTFILGVWQFATAFVFHRTPASFANAWILGLATAVLSLASMRYEPVRHATTAAGAWLLVAAFLLPHRGVVTISNDAAVGVAIVLLSLVPGTLYTSGHRRVSA